MKRYWWLFLLAGVLVVGLGAAFAWQDARWLAPMRAATHYSYQLLADEAEVMNECAECHEAEDFHTCATCHDDHGSAELASVPFNDFILLTGDVPGTGGDSGPTPRYVPINNILPYREQPNTHIALLDFLAQQGVTDFESVSLVSRDGGFVTLERQYLTGEALLMPHVDGVRFAAEDLHVSTWLKGVFRVVVVGVERPLLVNGRVTSMGRLLLGPTQVVTIEPADVMLKSRTDGEIRKGQTATRLEGVAVMDILGSQEYEEVLVRDAGGEQYDLAWNEVRDGLLAVLAGRSGVILVLPERGRAAWVFDVVEIEGVR